MPPMFVIVRIHPSGGRAFRLWIPIFLLWLLLLPFAILLLPVLFVVCLMRRTNPLAATAAVFAILGSFNGMLVEIDSPQAKVFVHVV